VLATGVAADSGFERANLCRRMPSSWMLRRVTVIRADVSKERVASIIRVARVRELVFLHTA
jgi:hypothetical protein